MVRRQRQRGGGRGGAGGRARPAGIVAATAVAVAATASTAAGEAAARRRRRRRRCCCTGRGLETPELVAAAEMGGARGTARSGDGMGGREESGPAHATAAAPAVAAAAATCCRRCPYSRAAPAAVLVRAHAAAATANNPPQRSRGRWKGRRDGVARAQRRRPVGNLRPSPARTCTRRVVAATPGRRPFSATRPATAAAAAAVAAVAAEGGVGMVERVWRRGRRVVGGGRAAAESAVAAGGGVGSGCGGVEAGETGRQRVAHASAHQAGEAHVVRGQAPGGVRMRPAHGGEWVAACGAPAGTRRHRGERVAGWLANRRRGAPPTPCPPRHSRGGGAVPHYETRSCAGGKDKSGRGRTGAAPG